MKTRGILGGASLTPDPAANPSHLVEGNTLSQTETTELIETAPAQDAAEDATPVEAHDHQHGPSLNPDLTREIEVEAPAEEVERSFKTVIKRYQKLARIPGFRAGKVPESLVRSKFAREVRQEVLERLVGQRFRQALDEQKLRPVSEPQVRDLQLFDGQQLRFKAAFEVMPEINLAGYEDTHVARPDVTLTEDEFQGEVARALESHATVATVDEDRELTDGDWAEIQFRGEIKDTAQTVTEEGIENATPSEPITGEDVLVEVGGKNTLPAFNEALRGSKPGQELRFEVDYPADFGEARLAGKTVGYDVTVKNIKSKTFPERDAEFAKQLGNYETWDDFETQLRERATTRKKEALENAAKDKMLEGMIERFPFPVPESFVQQQIEARLDRGLRALAQQGMSADEMRQLDFVRLRAAQRDQATNEVRASMILDRLAEMENVQVSDEDLDRELLIASIQAREPMEHLRERLTKDGALDRMRDQMRRERTGTAVYEKLAR